MSREILQGIINDFSPDKFTRFFRAKNRSFSPRQGSFSHYNGDSFAEGVKLGEIGFPSGEKLLACAFKSTQPLSERSSRKTQYEMGKKILKDTQSDAGIFIFYDSRGNFRFSLIYPQYIGRKRQWNNFRRFTYFASTELTNKTFLTRVGDGDFSSLEKIKDAFSVEKVTKEFYEQYRKLFEALVVDLDSNQTFRNEASRGRINTPDFAKKLIGQIVFLYFLQKKGWLGVPQNKPWGEGDKNFISNLYRRAVTDKENFFNDYLEVLFYDTLNNANREGADTSFSRYFNCRIPFLNGGLFEPEYDWHGTTIHLDNGVFKNIFEVFDRYNFTVEEESPDDKEVAVDPEMLGKVFENLLEENLRKGKGTYYTPREIVHYMCRESLINYLAAQTQVDTGKIEKLIKARDYVITKDNMHDGESKILALWENETKSLDRALSEIKVCDPACGSGAFLVGMLNEIVNARLVLDPAGSEYGLKKETIQNCIYGVDIDPGAVEIAKLRLWLSLVVDYELADIEPLPNLDYKIMCGNSLLEELIVGDESIELFDPRVLEKDKPKRKTSDKLMQMDFLKQDAEEYLKILRKLHLEYFHETDTQKKKIVRGRIEKIEMDFIQSSIDSRVKEIETRIKNLNMQKPEDRKKNTGFMTKKLEYLAIPNQIRHSKVRPYFLWHLNFFEVFQEKGGFDIVIANPPYIFARNSAQKGLTAKDKRYFYEHYRLAEYQVNLYPLFIEQAVQILRINGCLAFITPNNWLTINTNRPLRQFVLEKSNITLINFYARVFESADVDSAVVIFTNEPSLPVVRLYEYTDGLHFIKKAESAFFLNQKDHVINIEAFKTGGVAKLLNKIEQCSDDLGELADVRVGLKAYQVGKGQPSQTKEIKESRCFHSGKKLAQDYYKYLNGKDVCRYQLGWSGEYLRYGAHLAEPRKNFDLFSSRRILVRQIPAPPPYCIHACTANETYLNDLNSMNIINMSEVPELLLGIINSRLISFWFIHKFGKLQRGIFPQFKVNELASFPIAQNRTIYKDEIVRLVRKIMEAKTSNPNTDTTAWDRQIDQMVYRLYGLTEEEIKIVENSAK